MTPHRFIVLATALVAGVLTSGGAARAEWAKKVVLAAACRESFVAKTASRSQDHRVYVIVYDCRPGTGKTTQVILTPSQDDAVPEEYPPVFAVAGEHHLKVRWLSKSTLSIIVPHGAQVDRKVEAADGVTIVYTK